MFTCIICDYETNDSGNYYHHKKTKKHLLKEANNKNLAEKQKGI